MSSSEDLFDEPSTQQKSYATAAADTVTADSDCDKDNAQTSVSSQPVSTSQRPLSSCHPVTEHSCTSRRSVAHVTTFQITPTLRQRAFPRTNPSYIGTYRRDRPPAYRRIDSLGVASELRTTPSPAALSNGTRRPHSDSLQRALIQNTGDVVYLSNTGAKRVTNSSGHQCTTVVTHQPLTDRTVAASGLVMRPQSDGASSVNDCRQFSTDATSHAERYVDVILTASGGVVRRQSEPDYVNVVTRQHHHQHHHAQQHVPAAAPGRYYADDSECTSHSQLVPSAIYMNQHELTIAGRYTSRSTCNFMDHTANGR